MTLTGLKAIKYFEDNGNKELAKVIRSVEEAVENFERIARKFEESVYFPEEPEEEKQTEVDPDHLYDSYIESNLMDMAEANYMSVEDYSGEMNL